MRHFLDELRRCIGILSFSPVMILCKKVSKEAKIRNQNNQVPHLTQLLKYY